MNPYLYPNNSFCAGSTEHIIAVGLLVIIAILTTRWALKSPLPLQTKITRGFAWALVGNVLIWQFVKAYVSYLPLTDPHYVKYNWGDDLPLNPCNWLAFAALAYSYKPKAWVWYMMYFFVWVFTFNAVITPALFEGFPHYNFCKFWVAHTGLVMFVIHLLRIGAPEIKAKNVFQAYGYLQIFTIVCIGVNYLVGPQANYFFLSHKPLTASILDILMPWPYYIIQGDIIALGLFFLAWAPYAITRRLKARKF